MKLYSLGLFLSLVGLLRADHNEYWHKNENCINAIKDFHKDGDS